MATRTKFILTYIGGVVTGIVLVFVFSYCFAMSNVNDSTETDADEDADDGLEMFEEPTRTIDIRAFKVIQVMPDGSALASAEELGK